MDTKDPRFVSAYNDLVGAFFRFINVVNPAPSRDDQIRLICDSMTSLVNMLQNGSTTEVPSSNYYQPATNVQPVTTVSNPDVTSAPAPAPAPQPVVPETPKFSEKRYAIEPTYTAEDLYKFISRNLKKESAFDPEANPDAPDKKDYTFILEFNTEDGVFYLNNESFVTEILAGNFDKQVVELIGSPTVENMTVVEKGKIIKSTGGWEVVSPLKISSK